MKKFFSKQNVKAADHFQSATFSVRMDETLKNQFDCFYHLLKLISHVRARRKPFIPCEYRLRIMVLQI